MAKFNFILVFLLSILTSQLVNAINTEKLKLNLNGQFRLRHENYDIYQGRADKVDFTAMRLRVGLELNIGKKRKIFIAPQAVKAFGELNPETTSTGATHFNRTSGDKFDKELDFHEAYALIPAGDLILKLGRQELNYGESIILGNRDWTPHGQTFDAIKVSSSLFGGKIDLVYSKISNQDNTTFQDDITLTFLYYKAIHSKNQELDVYFIHNNLASNVVNTDTHSIGIRYLFKRNGLEVLTENIYQQFEKQSHSAYNLNFKTRYQLGSFTPFMNYSLASFRYDQLYTNRHRYNGHIDILGRKNLITYSLGSSYRLNSKWSLKAEVFHFLKQSNNSLAFTQSTANTLVGNINEDDLGQEVDVSVLYKPRVGESFKLAYSAFFHGDYFNDTKTSRFAYAQYLIKF